MITSCVYFVQCAENGLVKIGTCERHSLEGRMRAIVASSPLPVTLKKLGVLKGDRWEERKLHGRFAALRHHGEWFTPGPELLEFVARHAGPWPESRDAAAPDADRALRDLTDWVVGQLIRGELDARHEVLPLLKVMVEGRSRAALPPSSA